MLTKDISVGIPHNVLVVDAAAYERALYNSGLRGIMVDPKTNRSRSAGSTLSLENLLRSLNTSAASDKSDEKHRSPSPSQLPNCVLHNSGNDALMCLLAFQMLLDPSGTQIPVPKIVKMPRAGYSPSPVATPTMPLTPDSMMTLPIYTGNGLPMSAVSAHGPSAALAMSKSRPSSTYDLAAEFGQMQLGMGAMARTNSTGPFANIGKSFRPGRRQGKT